MDRRNQDRARRARNAVTHAQQQADELAVRAEQEQAHREQARVRQNAEQLSAATNKALESLEAAGFPGAVMVSCEERITEGIFTKRTKIKVVQEPGWSLDGACMPADQAILRRVFMRYSIISWRAAITTSLNHLRTMLRQGIGGIMAGLLLISLPVDRKLMLMRFCRSSMSILIYLPIGRSPEDRCFEPKPYTLLNCIVDV